MSAQIPTSVPNHDTIARLAGVARSTVSRALSGDPRIAEATRMKISKVAGDLNYHPQLNLGARLMAAHRTGRSLPLKTLGVAWRAIPQEFEPYHKSFMMGMLHGMIEACHELNHSLLVINLPASQSQVAGSFAQLDGLIAPAGIPKVINLMQDSGKPIVCIQNPDPEVASVEIDNHQAVRMAFQFLYQHGHRKIGWISPSFSAIPALRWAAYCECLKEVGLPYNARHVLSETTAPMEAQAGIAIRKLWSQPDRPTGIVVYNDLMALSILRTAREMGVRVPEELSLVSIDDIPEARMAFPALTTVAIGIEELGRQAVLLLEKFVRTGTYRPEKIQLNNFALKERGTVRPLGAAK